MEKLNLWMQSKCIMFFSKSWTWSTEGESEQTQVLSKGLWFLKGHKEFVLIVILFIFTRFKCQRVNEINKVACEQCTIMNSIFTIQTLRDDLFWKEVLHGHRNNIGILRIAVSLHELNTRESYCVGWSFDQFAILKSFVETFFTVKDSSYEYTFLMRFNHPCRQNC